MKTFTWQEFKELVNSKEYVLSSRRGLPDAYNQVETNSTIIKLIQESKGEFDWLFLEYANISSEQNQTIQFDEKTKTFHLIRKYYVEDPEDFPFEENVFITLYKAVDFS